MRYILNTESFAVAVRLGRREHSLTQAELSRLSGVSTGTLHRVREGQRLNSFASIISLAKVLKIDINNHLIDTRSVNLTGETTSG